jgi:hypothetical protein
VRYNDHQWFDSLLLEITMEHDDLGADADPFEMLIREVCKRIGQPYGGFHTMGPGLLNGEKCPEIAFHVGKLDKPRIVGGVKMQGTGIVYRALVGAKQTLVLDDKGKQVATFKDLTKTSLQ